MRAGAKQALESDGATIEQQHVVVAAATEFEREFTEFVAAEMPKVGRCVVVGVTAPAIGITALRRAAAALVAQSIV
jgi:flagellar biosynthesis/type III secretory pathway ATPase